MLQAYLLQLRLGLWSGNRRKMEIAESHGLPLITVYGSMIPVQIIANPDTDASKIRPFQAPETILLTSHAGGFTSCSRYEVASVDRS